MVGGHKVLIIEDDPAVRELVQSVLVQEMLEVHWAADGASGLQQAQATVFDLVILDLQLPGLDGLNICRELRRSQRMPVLILSARGDDTDKVVGLEVGADDYLVKPFSSKELVARARALLRRWTLWKGSLAEGRLLVRGKLSIDLPGRRVELSGQEISLTPLEFGILAVLAENAGTPITRQRILNGAWSPDYFGDERTVDVHIRNLRAKLRVSGADDFIQAVRGVGYKLA